MANIIDIIKNLPMKKKITLLSVLIVSIAGIVFLYSWLRQADYHVLYSNLAESDAGTVVQKLKDMRVPYKIEAGSILVPSDKVYESRLQLAAQGLPQGGGVGFELFDKTDFGTTDFVQKLNYRRAIQGELARTIMSLSEVEQCRVHLAMPEKSLFVQKEAKPSASLLLKLRPGRTLAQSQVQGIVHLVSSSVEGLNPKEVTIIDSRGGMLTRPVDDVAGLSNSQLEYQRNYEKDIESRIMGILEPVVGKDRVRAKVAALIDFTRSEKTEERFDPDGQVVRSEQRNIEKSTSAGSGTGGVPGTASNLPGKTTTQVASSQLQSQKQNEVFNYEISRVTSHVVSSSGDIKRLSVAVLVDGTYTGQQGSKEKKYSPRSEEDLRHYEDLVKKAIGFTESRGDEVRVTNMPFEVIPQEELPERPKEYLPIILSVVKHLAPIVAGVFFFLFIIRPLMKKLSAPSGTERRPELPLPQRVSEIERSMQPGALPMQDMKDDIVDWAKKNPQQASNLIKGWLEEK